MKFAVQHLLLATCCFALLPARAADSGPYVEVAIGRTVYDADCFYFECSSGHGNGGKIGGGYQFGVFALEGWVTDWGKGAIAWNDHIQLRSVGVNGAWSIHFGNSVQGLLRAGAAQVRQTRSSEDFRHIEGTLGLGLLVDLAPSTAAVIAWDFTTSTGGSDRVGTVLAQFVTLGLRLRF